MARLEFLEVPYYYNIKKYEIPQKNNTKKILLQKSYFFNKNTNKTQEQS